MTAHPGAVEPRDGGRGLRTVRPGTEDAVRTWTVNRKRANSAYLVTELADGKLPAEADLYRVLGKTDQRADYDARSGARLPELEITPSEVVLRAFDPTAREINFSVHLKQVAGPPFDPSMHRIDLTLAPPWHQAEVHWHWSRDTLPAEVDFTLAFGDGLLQPGATLSGDIDLT